MAKKCVNFAIKWVVPLVTIGAPLTLLFYYFPLAFKGAPEISAFLVAYIASAWCLRSLDNWADAAAASCPSVAIVFTVFAIFLPDVDFSDLSSRNIFCSLILLFAFIYSFTATLIEGRLCGFVTYAIRRNDMIITLAGFLIPLAVILAFGSN